MIEYLIQASGLSSWFFLSFHFLLSFPFSSLLEFDEKRKALRSRSDGTNGDTMFHLAIIVISQITSS